MNFIVFLGVSLAYILYIVVMYVFVMRASRSIYEAIRVGRSAARYRALLKIMPTHEEAYKIDSEIISQLEPRDRQFWPHLVSDPLCFALWKLVPAVYLAIPHLYLAGWSGLVPVAVAAGLGILLRLSTAATAFKYLDSYLEEHAPESEKESVISWEKAKALVVASVPLYMYAAIYPFVSFYNLVRYGEMVNGWFTVALVPAVFVVVCVHKFLVHGVLYDAAKHIRYMPVPQPPGSPNRRMIDPQPERFTSG